ncbi:MAG TPA: ribonuclease PH [Spirochaetota bacterium]|nr:ribonuclease PH [Spirochaetota bacterium]
MNLTRTSTRGNSSIRNIEVIPDFCPHAMGSVLFSTGNTRVICAASITQDVPDHALKKNEGWLTAEYTMLPYSTLSRKKRDTVKRDGRSVEIQRLIGRSLRAGVDFSLIPGISVFVDCDVIQADGGTRTASITGGFIAIKLAFAKMLKEGVILSNPVKTNIAAVSVGIVDNELLLDLDYSEDSRAMVDMNIVMDGDFNLIEIQGAGEQAPFSVQKMNEMVKLAQKGITGLFEIQNRYC